MKNMRADEILFTPPQISTLAKEQIDREILGGKAGMRTGISQLDDHFVMIRPGKFIGILADTSHGKSSFMTFLSRNLLEQLADDEIGVYCTWEDSVEDFGIADISAYSGVPISSVYNGDITETQLKRLMKGAADRAASPLWVIGHSEARRTARPRLTMTDIMLAMDNILSVQRKKVRFIMFDYLQQVNLSDVKVRETRLRYAEAIGQMKDLALGYNLTTFCATQINRKVSERKWKMPQVHDAMETSNFEHTCDGAIGLWFVSRSSGWNIGDTVQEAKELGDVSINVTKDLMLIETLKQKKGAANELRALDFIPEYNHFVGYGQANTYRRKRHEEAL